MRVVAVEALERNTPAAIAAKQPPRSMSTEMYKCDTCLYVLSDNCFVTLIVGYSNFRESHNVSMTDTCDSVISFPGTAFEGGKRLRRRGHQSNAAPIRGAIETLRCQQRQ